MDHRGKGIMYLRELAVQEIIHSDPQTIADPDEVQCTRPMLQKFVWSAPAYADLLETLDLGASEKAPTVGEVAEKMWQY